MGRPVVEHFNTNIFLNSIINGEDLFSTVDPDGDAINFFRVEDYQDDPTGGFFRLNGVAQTNGSQFVVEAADLPNLEYVSGSRIGREGFRVIAVDVTGEFSVASDFGLLYTVRENVTRPFVLNRPFNALANEATPVEPFVQGFDPDGFPITQYFIRDRFVDAGFLSLDGEVLPQGEYHLIQTEDLGRVTYTTSGPNSSEPFDIFAYDGELWSERGTYDVGTTANVNRPVAQFTRGDAISRETIQMAPLANITDDDNNTIKYYEFWNTSPHSVHGELIFNGVVQPRKQWIRVEANELDQLQYEAPNFDFVQQIRYRGNDGKFLSGNGTISITTEFVAPPISPELANVGHIYDQQLVNYSLTDLFTRTDSGRETIRYQIYDGNAFDERSARFEFNNNELDALTIHDFTAAEADAFVRLRTGDFNNRHQDPVLARVQNADGLWTSWSKLDVRTEPEFIGAHDIGNTWFNVPAIPTDSFGRLELSYSFMQDFPDYETGTAEDEDPPEDFTPFNQNQRISVRRAFDSLEQLSNIKFIEVSDQGTNVLGQRGGIYRFGNYGADDDEAQAFTFGPSAFPQSGDIWFNRILINEFRPEYDPQLPFGGSSYTTLLHEIMHTLGFQHTFEPSGGSAVLPDATNTDNFSVLSTFTGQRADGLFPTTPQLYDTESVQRNYGVNTNYRPGDDIYSLADFWTGRQAFTETIWDGGGSDTLSLAGSDPTIGQGQDLTSNLYTNKIDLSPGGFSTINGFNENVVIAFRAEIENAIGSDLDDEILGNHLANVVNAGNGNDSIEGRQGDDTLTGGTGSDLFVFGVGDGNDVIDEQQGAGRDTIQLSNFPTLDSLENDLRFSLNGRDLTIDLKLDNSDIVDGSVTITNQIWGAYRIESLELNGTKIDLKNLTEQITPTTDSFRITDDTSIFGNLVVPV